MPRGARLLLAVMLTACRRPSPAIVEDAAPSAPPPPTTKGVSPASSSTTRAAATDARVVIEQWNRAHNEHDADKLAALYAPKVSFYGATLSNADCAKKKRSAFAATPNPVGDIAVTCARRCAVQAHDCGFSFTLHDMNPHSADDPKLTVSSWMGVVEVEPVSKTLWWEDFAADGASVWHSEAL